VAANNAEAADSTSTSSGSASIEELIKAEASAVRAAGTTDRFVSVNSELSGVLIICCMDAAVDIVATVRHICSQIVARRERRTRFLVRLTPLSSTCYGDLHNFSALAAAAVPAAFAALPPSSGVQWAVQLTRRYTGVQRSEAIAMLGKLVPEQHTVHLADPDVVVMAEAVKCIAGLSVVSDYRAHGYGGFHLRALQEAHCGKGLDSKLDDDAAADDE
jgi:THUMP domain